MHVVRTLCITFRREECCVIHRKPGSQVKYYLSLVCYSLAGAPLLRCMLMKYTDGNNRPTPVNLKLLVNIHNKAGNKYNVTLNITPTIGNTQVCK